MTDRRRIHLHDSTWLSNVEVALASLCDQREALSAEWSEQPPTRHSPNSVMITFAISAERASRQRRHLLNLKSLSTGRTSRLSSAAGIYPEHPDISQAQSTSSHLSTRPTDAAESITNTNSFTRSTRSGNRHFHRLRSCRRLARPIDNSQTVACKHCVWISSRRCVCLHKIPLFTGHRYMSTCKKGC